jgi:hypothetical protein
MKKLIFSLATLLVFSITANAQSDTDEIAFIQSIFGMEKKELVAEFIDPASTTANTFWSLYDSYETERKALGKDRIALLQTYVDVYETADTAQIDAIMKDVISLGKANDKLIEKYYKKIKKEVSALEAAEFFQIEAYILSSIRVEILDNIPFFGELD